MWPREEEQYFTRLTRYGFRSKPKESHRKNLGSDNDQSIAFLRFTPVLNAFV
jgi:hypothetical protein